MLKSLRLTEVGPASQIDLKLASRLNMITGDNGLGKTFILECAWWALAGTWAGYQAYPHQKAKQPSNISFRINGADKSDKTQRYQWEQQTWIPMSERQELPGLSIYCLADGSFAVWDPAKHLLQQERGDTSHGNPALFFSSAQVRNGTADTTAKDQRDQTGWRYNGLLQDWISWQYASDQSRFTAFTDAIGTLSSYQDEPLLPGEPQSIAPDSRKIPTLKFPYGEVPIVHCAAGYQRMIALAYMLVWAWYEHVAASEKLQHQPRNDIVLLVDEMEAHLHPKWQRAIIPSLMQVMQTLSAQLQTQLLIATHSPLVLASIESFFDNERDRLFHLYLEHDQVRLDTIDFVKRGRADLWLISNVFGLKQPRSKVAEEIIEEAKYLQQIRRPARGDVEKVSHRLIDVLAPDDEFWPRWKYFAERSGVPL